jgi:perosamine synthetase
MAKKAASYRNLCFRPERRFYHTELGNNYRMTNLQAALGVAQMERIEEFINIKRRLGKYYQEKLSSIKGIKTQIEKPWAKTVYWMYCIELDRSLGLNANEMITELKKRDIGSRPFFLGLHEQPALKKLGFFKDEHYPITERISAQGLYLPSGLTLNEAQIDEVVSAVRSVLFDRRPHG